LKFLSRRRASQPFHVSHPHAAFRNGFGNDFIGTGFVELAEAVEEADGGFGKLAIAGAEGEDLLPIG
jgi:hypothetical protein